MARRLRHGLVAAALVAHTTVDAATESAGAGGACGRTFSSPRHNLIDQALIYTLCDPSPTAAAALPFLRAPKSSSVGFFGHLNTWLQQVYDHVYVGEGAQGKCLII